MTMLPSRSRLFEDFFRDLSPGFFIKPLHGDALPNEITLDIKESDEAYTLHAELPGVAKEDIHVTIDGAVVSIRAEVRQHDSHKQDERLLRSERYYGSVARSIRLPQEVNDATAVAKCENGVLTLVLPKRTQAQGAKRLNIS